MKKIAVLFLIFLLFTGCSYTIAETDNYSGYYEYGYRQGYLQALDDLLNNTDILTDYANDEGIYEDSWDNCMTIMSDILTRYYYGMEETVKAYQYSEHLNEDYIPDIKISN